MVFIFGISILNDILIYHSRMYYSHKGYTYNNTY